MIAQSIPQNRNIKITDYKAPELDAYARDTENMLAHYYEPNGGLFVAESPKVISRAVNAGCEPVSFLLETKMLGDRIDDVDISEEANMPEILRMREILRAFPDVPVYTAALEILMKITGYKLTRGALCLMKRPVLPSVEEICLGKRSEIVAKVSDKAAKQNPVPQHDSDPDPEKSGAAAPSRLAVLYNIENPTNVGAIFRSAAALGIDGILLTKDCSDPFYRRAARVSMGTVFQIPWTYLDDPACLRRYGFKTAAMALSASAVSIEDSGLMAEKKLAIILGNEGNGLPDGIISASDYTVMIPMNHDVDSLNVAAASAVAFWQLCRPAGRM